MMKRYLLNLVALLATVSSVAKPPNFIIFYTDDQGWADTSVRMDKSRADSADAFFQTPHLERMAREGMVFSNAYSPAPTCTPSRISIQYGKSPARIKQTVVHDVLAKKAGINGDGEVSMADVIKQGNSRYVTAHFGKGMAIRRMEDTGYDVTDEHVDPDSGSHGLGNYHGDWRGVRDKRPLPKDDPKRIVSLTKSATSFIDEQAKADRPFFMMVSHYAVHVHHQALAETIEKYRHFPRPAEARDIDYLPEDQIPEGHKVGGWLLQYAAMIEDMDSSLGAILDRLDRYGIADNTYVIFMSDNGGGFGVNGPLTGGKAKMMEGGLRVPTVVRGPGVLKNAQCDVPVVQWDLLQTIHDLSGSNAPLPEDLDGGSWRSVLEHGNRGEVKRENPFLVFHYPYYAGVPVSAIRVGDYKFMRQLHTGETRLHNVVKDLAEKDNLLESMPEKAAAMSKMMDQYLKEIGAEGIKEMFDARFEELDGYTKQSLDEIAKWEAKLAQATTDAERDECKGHIKRQKENIERHDKQRADTERNMKVTKWM